MEGLGKKVGRMKDIFYDVIKADLVVLNGESDFRRRSADESGDLDGLRIIEEGMEGAAQFVQVLVAEIVVGHDDRPEEQDQQK